MPQPSDLIQFLRQSAILVWRAAESGSVEALPEWAALTGTTPEELAGDGWMSVVHPDDAERVRMAWRTAVLHGSVYNTEYRVRHADGIYRWVNSRGIPILNSDGAVIYWVGAVFAIPGGLRNAARPQAQATRADPKDFTDIAPAAIRAARGALNMSAAELAKEAGMSISTVRRLEEDTRNSENFRASSMDRILAALARRKLRFIGEGSVVTGIDASEAAL